MSLRIFRGQPIPESASNPAILPDPMKKLPHPGNQELFKYLADHWQQEGFPPDKAAMLSPYGVSRSFDRVADSLTTIEELKKLTIYGARLAANVDNLVFAWAQGADAIFVKLPPAWHQDAQSDGGRLDATYPPDWMEFLVGGTRMPSTVRREWQAVIQHWMQVAYDDSRANAMENLGAHSHDATRQRRAAIGTSPTTRPDHEAIAARITLTLTAPEDDFDSLNPLYRALVEPIGLEVARQHRTHTGQAVTVVSKNGRSVSFPHTKRKGILSALFEAPPTAVIIRGNLSDVLPISDKLANWLICPGRRKAKLEIWEASQIEVEAQSPEELQWMFQFAVKCQETTAAASL